MQDHVILGRFINTLKRQSIQVANGKIIIYQQTFLPKYLGLQDFGFQRLKFFE
jgi:formyltetrahydrofolate hydrolase